LQEAQKSQELVLAVKNEISECLIQNLIQTIIDTNPAINDKFVEMLLRLLQSD
jgi:hypothetical protein